MTPVDFSAFCPGRTSEDGCNFAVVLTVPTPAGPINIQRGWVGVEIRPDDKVFRVVNTHLEQRFAVPEAEWSAIFQAAQAQELTTVLGYTLPDRTLILAGDFNSSPVDAIIDTGDIVSPILLPPLIVPPYMQILAEGYTDVWDLREGGDAGFACCQDADLVNMASVLYERIDMIFSREMPLSVKQVLVTGDRKSDKSAPFGLWPSDHAQVSATLGY